MVIKVAITTARNRVTIGRLARTIIVEPWAGVTVGMALAGTSSEGIVNLPVAMDGTTDVAATATVDLGAENMPSIAAVAAVAVVTTSAVSLTIAVGISFRIAATDHITLGVGARDGATGLGGASTLPRDISIGAAATIVANLPGVIRTTVITIFHTGTTVRTRADQSSSQVDTLLGGTPAVGATGMHRASRITVNGRTTAVITRIMRSFAHSADIRTMDDIISLPTIAITDIKTATRSVSRRRMEKEATNRRRRGRRPSSLTSPRLTRPRMLVAAVAVVRVASRCAKPC